MAIDLESIRHLYPFESHYLTMGKHRYHYIDEGTGDPLVMIHGNPTWSFYYRHLIRELSKEYRTIAVDHMGCGLSDKPGMDTYDYRLKSRVDNLETLIDHLNPDRKITLIVHDWGGMIGLCYALRHPEKIGRIVITNTSGFFPPGKGIPLRLWIMRYLTPFAKIGTLGFNLFSRAALYMAPKKSLSADVKKGLTAPYNSWRNRMATYRFVQDIPLKPGDASYDLVKSVDENLGTLKSIPMTILWGKHDFIFTMEYFNEWKRRFPEVEALLFPEAGHYLLEDEPEKVCEKIQSFLLKNPIAE
ncbi:MAG: alpha/beta fold hydrolase [Proteobacteria bacterium]|nr:alpha/beta fold hydrolase [Pseudomonadota bacterium]